MIYIKQVFIPGSVETSTSLFNTIFKKWFFKCSTYEHFIYRGKLITDKLLKQEYQLSRLKSTFRKFYGRYNDLVCDYSISLNKCWDVCLMAVVEASVPIVTSNCSSLFSLKMHFGLAAGVTSQQGMLTPPWHLIPPLVFRGPCCHWVCICFLDVSYDYDFGIFDSYIINYSL